MHRYLATLRSKLEMTSREVTRWKGDIADGVPKPMICEAIVWGQSLHRCSDALQVQGIVMSGTGVGSDLSGNKALTSAMS